MEEDTIQPPPRFLRAPMCDLRVLCAKCLPFTLLCTTLPAQTSRSAFRYTRQVSIPAQLSAAANACAVLDAAVYAHTTPTLSDLRLFSPSGDEIPYAITLSGTASTEADPAKILNPIAKDPRHLTFDLQMPARPYSALDLTLAAHDFVVSARLTGLASLPAKNLDKPGTYLGTFTLYDLTAQALGRDTTLQFAESTYPYLRVELQFTPSPGTHPPQLSPETVTAAAVPPTRQAQTLYTTVAQTTAIESKPGQSLATLALLAHVPAERVTVDLAPNPAPSSATNFSRAIQLSAQTLDPGAPVETVAGHIARLVLTVAGHAIHSESLSIPAILGANAREPATVTVSIANGLAPPLPIRSIRLEMRQRKLCFPVPAAQSATLAYGAPLRTAPTYTFPGLFHPADPTRTATLSPELPNPQFHPAPPPERPRLPLRALLAIALLALVSALALRRTRRECGES